VRFAQSVENEVANIRIQAEPRIRSTIKDAEAEWLQFRSRTPHSDTNNWGLRSQAFVSRTETRTRVKLASMLEKTTSELEKIRSRLLRETPD